MTSTAPTFAEPADFPDRLSPILVKELRQGLRSRVFVLSFVLAHVCVVIVIGLETLLVMAQGREAAGRQHLVALQWIVEFLFLCVLLPARVINASGEENCAGASDLLRLTNFDASALVFGKWKTQLLLATVLLVSLAPYHFLRYYTSGVDVVSQALVLVWAWTESAFMSAVSLSLSTVRPWARCVWLAVLFLPFWFTILPAGLLLSGDGAVSQPFLAMIVWGTIWFGLTMFFLTLAINGFDTHIRLRHSNTW